MRLIRIIIKLELIVVIQLFLFSNSCFAQIPYIDTYERKPQENAFLSPALQISVYNFQQDYYSFNEVMHPAIIGNNREYVIFIKELELIHGNMDDILRQVKKDYPQYRQAINDLLLYESQTNYPSWLLRHSNEVAIISYHMAKELGFRGQTLAELVIGARFHDIGKSLSRPQLINQTRELTLAEKYEIIEHTYESYEILRNNGIRSQKILWSAFCHHENEDGTGYPDRLASEDISQEAKIIRVADSFSAILGNRPYYNGNGSYLDTAKLEIDKGKNTLYSPLIVDVFDAMFLQIKERMDHVRYLDAFENYDMDVLMSYAEGIDNHWPLAKVACGLFNPLNKKMKYKAANSLGVHRHAEVNLVLDVFQDKISEKKLFQKQRNDLLNKLTQLEVLSYTVKIDESPEALELLDELSRQTDNPFKGMTILSTLRPCDNCIEMFNRLGVKEIIFAQDHVDSEFIVQSQAAAEQYKQSGILIKQARLYINSKSQPNKLFFELCQLEGMEELGNVINEIFIQYLEDNITNAMKLEDIHYIVSKFSGLINAHTSGIRQKSDFTLISNAIKKHYDEAERNAFLFKAGELIEFLLSPNRIVVIEKRASDLSEQFFWLPVMNATWMLGQSNIIGLSI